MERTRTETSRKVGARLVGSAITLLLAAPLSLAGAAPASAGTLDHIRETGQIRLGYRADARPLSFKDETGQPAGYSVALCHLVVDAVKAELGLAQVNVVWVPVTVEYRFKAVQQGEVDLLCGAETVTLARRQEVDFSIPVFPGGIGALLRADASPRLKDTLSGRAAEFRPTWRASAGQILQAKNFSVVKGTTAEKWLAGKMGEFHVLTEMAPVDSYDAGVQRLLERKSDVFFGDRALLLGAAARSPAAKDLVVLDRYFTIEPIALGLARGDEDFRLAVDRALSRFFASGQLGDLYSKWIGEPEENTLLFFEMSAQPE
jgi:putrescine:ornithine antiporter